MPSATERYLSHLYAKLDGEFTGETLAPDVIEVSVESSLHLPDVATLSLHDSQLKWVDDGKLVPGKTLEIYAKIGQTDEKVFDGEITELEPEFEASTLVLKVTAFDRLHRLGRGRMTRTWVQVTDSDLANKIAGEMGLQQDVDSTSETHPFVFQANESNVDFLRRRAARIGYLLYVDGQKLCFKKPAASGAPIDLAWTKELHEFRPRLTSAGQVKQVTVRGWDPKQKQAVTGQASSGTGAPQVGAQSSMGKTGFGGTGGQPMELTGRPVRSAAEATTIAQAEADRRESGFIEAEGICDGNPKIMAGVKVEVKGVGTRFSGTYLVTSATHTYSSKEGYLTRFSVSGFGADTLLGLLAAGQSAGTSGETGYGGVMIGLVTNSKDPEGRGRVKVKYPGLSDQNESDWARVLSIGGGPKRGIEFIPEVNDEVLVCFEQGDIHHPYVLGGLWNGKDDPPAKNSGGPMIEGGGTVAQRIIQSRYGHVVTLDDTQSKEKIEVKTPSGHKLTLDDTRGSEHITIVDKTGNNKIIITSTDNCLKVTMDGKVTIECKQDFSVDSQGKVSIKGLQGVEVSTPQQIKLSGTAGAELSSTATTAVKGSMVNVEGTGPTTVKGNPIQLN